jgi:hypothetical protein
MVNGTVIENMVVGGPAFNSGQLVPGDSIVQIDGKLVTAKDLFEELVGSDIPGTTVTLTVKSKRDQIAEKRNPLWFVAHSPASVPAVLRDPETEPQAVHKTVVLTKIASEVIADRRRLFELFTNIKVCQILMSKQHK